MTKREAYVGTKEQPSPPDEISSMVGPPSRLSPDVEPFDAEHVLMTYPATEQNPEGVRHIVRTEAIFSDEDIARARQKRALLTQVMERASRIENPVVLQGLIRQMDEALIDGDQG